ncbi:MAG TPA: energy-coupling factor transporter transmembrane component T [Dissulfurispiraceae bacterium]|nr:energy-coupling factor transporter transmembrane component T [Dissulfurispiraceae bacterium]
MKSDIPSFLLSASDISSDTHSVAGGSGHADISYLEKGIKDFAALFTEGYAQWELSARASLLHDIDARVKIIFLAALTVVISLKRTIMPEAMIFIFIFILALFCRLNLISFYKKVILMGFLFGFLISAPSSLNIIVPGKVVLPLIVLSHPVSFWLFDVPQVIGITDSGISLVSLLTLRVLNSLSISFLILYTTPFADIIKALKVFRVPDALLVMISMTYKYIFIFAHIVSDMYLAKKARLVRGSSRKEAREWIAGRIAFVFKKTQIECEEVFKAMTARGFSGEVRIYHHRHVNMRDWTAGLFLLSVSVGFLLI